MLEMRTNCENCDRDLPAEIDGAVICSLECTFCTQCNLDACPNCGGQLSPRPTRAQKWQAKYPPSATRVSKAV